MVEGSKHALQPLEKQAFNPQPWRATVGVPSPFYFELKMPLVMARKYLTHLFSDAFVVV